MADTTRNTDWNCNTCHVRFHDINMQRDHYKSDWHRYNVKRKVLNIPPVSAEAFQDKVAAQEAEKSASEKKNITHYCTLCRKSFGNEKALNSHLVSNKHLEAVKSSSTEDAPVEGNSMDTSTTQVITRSAPESTLLPPAPVNEIAMDEDVDDEDWEEVEGVPIPTNICLFCEEESKDIEKNLRHMSSEHSFFIPDAEYCSDIDGLLEYLGEKVGEGMVCLWCDDRSRQFYTLQAVQQHMRDKGHCKIRHEGASVLEYTDFYDYSASYPDGEGANPDELYQPEPAVFNESMQLVLPSGVTLGHRALKIYYKQYVRPGSQLVTRQTKKSRLLQQYKAIGYSGSSLAAAQLKYKDQKYFKWARDKYQLKLGVHGNKTKQHHFRAQVQF